MLSEFIAFEISKFEFVVCEINVNNRNFSAYKQLQEYPTRKKCVARMYLALKYSKHYMLLKYINIRIYCCKK